MSIFDILTLFGGLAMFLYGMRLMGDGLKESSSGALKKAMESVTNNPVKAFLLGLGVTAIIQSSTATIVITSGLVAAGLLTLHQSLGIIIGANVGTTVTGQIIRLLDLDSSGGTSWLQIFKPSSLAPIALIIGIIVIMGGRFRNSRQIDNIAIGFGSLFSGLLNMTSAVTVLTESGAVESLFTGLGNNPILGYVTGAGVAFVLQSSSATIGILQAFSASGRLTFKAVYPVIVGVYLGDSVTTAIVCYIGAGAEQRRVGIVNTLYNLCKSAMVLIVVAILHQLGFLDSLWDRVANSGLIVKPEYRQRGLAKKIKHKAFELSRQRFPNAKIFGLTTGLAVMKINTELGYVPVTFSELTDDPTFWKGCESCVNYDVLLRNNYTRCLCTGMLYDPAKHHETTESEIHDQPLNLWMKLRSLVHHPEK